MGEITIRLALQTHGAELGSHVAIRGGFIKGGLPYTSHFGGHKEGQHALDGIKGNVQISTTWLKSYKGVKLRIHLNMCGGILGTNPLSGPISAGVYVSAMRPQGGA